MKRYIDAEKLLAEIERQITKHKKNIKRVLPLISKVMLMGSLVAYESIKRFITLKQALRLCGIEKQITL